MKITVLASVAVVVLILITSANSQVLGQRLSAPPSFTQIPAFTDLMDATVDGKSGSPRKLGRNGSLVTKESFKPPVEIIIEAETDGTNLRIGYAADQIIFNWERDRTELRVDGGPASGKNQPGKGAIPAKQYVTIRWVVLPGRQSIYVDNQLRFEHEGDYSSIEKPIVVRGAEGSSVTVKSLKIRQIPSNG